MTTESVGDHSIRYRKKGNVGDYKNITIGVLNTIK